MCILALSNDTGSTVDRSSGVKRHVLSFVTDDPNPMFSRMDLPFKASFVHGALAFKKTQPWFNFEPNVFGSHWMSIPRCALMRQQLMRYAFAFFGQTDFTTTLDISPFLLFAQGNLSQFPVFESAGGLISDRDRALNPRIGSIADLLTAAGSCIELNSALNVGGRAGKREAWPQIHVFRGMAENWNMPIADPITGLLGVAESYRMPPPPNDGVQRVRYPPASVSRPLYADYDMMSQHQDVYFQGSYKNISVGGGPFPRRLLLSLSGGFVFAAVECPGRACNVSVRCAFGSSLHRVAAAREPNRWAL